MDWKANFERINCIITKYWRNYVNKLSPEEIQRRKDMTKEVWPCRCGCGQIIQKYKMYGTSRKTEIRYYARGHYMRLHKKNDDPWIPPTFDLKQPEKCEKCASTAFRIDWDEWPCMGMVPVHVCINCGRRPTLVPHHAKTA